MQTPRYVLKLLEGEIPLAVLGEEILERLKQAGYKFTGKRREIVQLFASCPDDYMTAKDVMQFVEKRFPNISFDTVYRTLTILEENGAIERSEFNDDAVRYRLTCQERHHHHLICLGCGKTKIVAECPMSHVPADDTDFTVVHHRFELYGYCAECRP